METTGLQGLAKSTLKRNFYIHNTYQGFKHMPTYDIMRIWKYGKI